MLSRRAALAAPLILPALAHGQEAWPSRPIRIIIAFPAGSVTDTLHRNLVEPLSRELGVPVIIDNRPGGNGVVGTEAGARAAPDGYTWTVLSVTNGALNTYTVRRLSYDPLKDFVSIGYIADNPYVLAVRADHPAKDLRGLIEMARREPGKLTYSTGNSSSHIASATLASMAGVEMVQVPYRGGPEALTDVIAGRIDSTFTDIPAGLAQQREGRIRLLATTYPTVFPLTPEIPPVSSVLPGYGFAFWFGMAAPAGTPAPIIARANAAMNKVLADPAMATKLAGLGYLPGPGEPAKFTQVLRQQIEELTARAKAAGIEQQ
jgi:tripartite-type tricarboxylate transporter receptor subunit TctC